MPPITGQSAYANAWSAPPDDAVKSQAAHIREVATIALSNTRYIREEYLDRYAAIVDLQGIGAQQPIDTTQSQTYVDSTKFSVDIPVCRVGEDIDLHFASTAVWTGSNTTWGEYRLLVIENAGGAGVSTAVPGARAHNSATNLFVPISIRAVHRVTLAGTLRVRVQLLSPNGVGKTQLWFAGRLDAARVRRVVT